MSLRFTWDPPKAAANLQHGVSLIEASTALADAPSITISDHDHSASEERSVLVGRSDRNRLLIVAHVERGDLIRIINARLATRRERKTYEEEA